MTISTVQNYRDKIMQIFTARYNLEFRKFTSYGLTRPQSIWKSKQISGQTILSSPQDLDLNPKFAKNRDIPMVQNSVTPPVTPAVQRWSHAKFRHTICITSFDTLIIFRRVILFQYNIYFEGPWSRPKTQILLNLLFLLFLRYLLPCLFW